jgi:uncharacterized protein (DUF2249 family)
VSKGEGTGRPKASDITPETRVGALLDRFPELEGELLSMSPEFERLRNPVLRKTVAKVATLRQVAQVGKVPLAELINRLRAAAGLEGAELAEAEAGTGEPAATPGWFSPGAVAKSLDARPLLSAGIHPMGQVMKDLSTLDEGQIYELVTPFLPAPLIDMAKGKGYRTWSRTEAGGVVRTYFTRGAQGSSESR